MIASPLRLVPLYHQRVWGGRTLESLYRRPLPQDGKPYGESWEIVDRADEQSVVRDGPLAGKSLHELWSQHREEVFGKGLPDSERFPLLVKILDCRDRLSIQVHPPQAVAPQLGGEPKTEMWYIVKAEPEAHLYVGLDQDATRSSFQDSIEAGTTESEVHAIPAQAGQSIFIPSGRLHAIGAGFLIFEIQQNSDTTYRVFDWNRIGLDGQPRQLHIEESLQCIDFQDVEPTMDSPQGSVLAECEYFRVEKLALSGGEGIGKALAHRFAIFAVVTGQVSCGGHHFEMGDFFIIPATADLVVTATSESAEVLRTTIPE
ncbi:MAG: type I phosphomannose isomerase catalytic subunit [Verrucomicrobiota bacterium]